MKTEAFYPTMGQLSRMNEALTELPR